VQDIEQTYSGWFNASDLQEVIDYLNTASPVPVLAESPCLDNSSIAEANYLEKTLNTTGENANTVSVVNATESVERTNATVNATGGSWSNNGAELVAHVNDVRVEVISWLVDANDLNRPTRSVLMNGDYKYAGYGNGQSQLYVVVGFATNITC